MEWKKISEELPPKDSSILFYDGDNICEAYYNDKGDFFSQGFYCNDEDCTWIYDDCHCTLKVTDDCYWMPLPPPPNK